jgi:hypothetical protein
MADQLLEVRAREAELGREWSGLQAALLVVAEAHAKHARGDASGFRHLQLKADEVERQRVHVAQSIAELQATLRDRG